LGARLAGVALAAVLLAACATLEQNLDKAKVSWQGAAYDEVEARWGKPVRSEKRPDGTEIHTWVSEGPIYQAGGPSVGLGVFGGSRGGGVGVGVSFPFGGTAGPTPRCERALVFREGRVIEQIWAGPPDYCVNFGRT
jgi:hypothetical protein